MGARSIQAPGQADFSVGFQLYPGHVLDLDFGHPVEDAGEAHGHVFPERFPVGLLLRHDVHFQSILRYLANLERGNGFQPG